MVNNTPTPDTITPCRRQVAKIGALGAVNCSLIYACFLYLEIFGGKITKRGEK
ncbi:MAG: hypothetical protein ACPG49_12155 [Chitinophagales bacterium]